jgi:hypothetical protein
MPSGGGGGGMGYDISASYSRSTSLNPVAQFGNVTGGGSFSWKMLVIIAGLAVGGWLIWRFVLK